MRVFPSRRVSVADKLLAAAFVAALSLLPGAAGYAQNLVVNGDFASNPSGWSVAYHAPEIAMAWSDLDPADPTPSGSLQVTSIISNGGSGGPTQCVDLIGAELEFHMDVLVPSQPAFGYVDAFPYVRWYSGAGCTVAEISLDFAPGSVSAGQGWTRIAEVLAPPGSAQSVLIDLGIAKPSGSGAPAIAYFDNVYLPEPDASGLGVAALAALAISRRRIA